MATTSSLNRLFALIMFLPALFFSGCQTIGPEGIRQGRQEYNEAIQRTNDEQMLLNLVRLQYRDVPLFLQVGSVSSQMRFESGAGVNASFRNPGRALQGYGASASLGVSDSPTVSYAPLQGEAFTEQLLRPISIESILLLYHSGWSIERVLRLTVQRANGERNAFNASGPTPDYPPRYENFTAATLLLRSLQIQDGIDLGYERVDGSPVPVLFVAPAAAASEPWREAARLLRLDPDGRSYPIRAGTALGQDRHSELTLNTRSLMGVMHFLSQGVQVPEGDRAAGRVTTTLHPDGTLFDWTPVLAGLMTIRSASRAPRDAAVAVEYRGWWFYVDDSDLASKSTFSLLSQLFQLETSQHAMAAPVLTLPVGR